MERTPRPAKVATVDEIREKLGASSAALLTEYRGLSVRDLAKLRAALRPSGAQYKVYKNTLARRAAADAGQQGLVDLLVGPTAITFVSGDPVEAARALRDFAKTSPLFAVKGGLLGGRVLSAGDVNALADIEPRDVLLAKIAGAMQAPMVKAAGLFQAFTRNMAYGIKALIDQRVAGGEGLPVADAQTPEAHAPVAAAEAAEPAIERAEPVIEPAEPAIEAELGASVDPSTEALPESESLASADTVEPVVEAEAPAPVVEPEAPADPAG